MSHTLSTTEMLGLRDHPPVRVALAEGEDPRVQEAACQLLKQEVAQSVTLFAPNGGRPSLPPGLGALKDRWHWRDPSDVSLRQETMATVKAQDEARGKDRPDAQRQKLAEDPLVQAGHLLHHGQVDLAVAGAVRSTGDVIRAALATVGTASQVKTVSSFFAMAGTLPNSQAVYRCFYACAGVVIDPTREQMVDIAASTCDSWRRVYSDRPPVVAFLSFSTKGSASHAHVAKVAEAAAQFRASYPDIVSDGELQFDAAFSGEVGQRKAPGSAVPGHSNCFIFPNLDAGNIAYKITQRLAGFSAIGPNLQGLARPYCDLSRGATADDIVQSVRLNSLRVD